MVHETGRATEELLPGRCNTWRNCEEYNGHNPALPVFQAGEMFNRMFERLFLAWVLAFERESLPWDNRAARPWESVRETNSVMSGPGVIARMTLAMAN